MAKSLTMDMTKGNPAKILIFFTIPILIGNIFQQLYNVVDSVIVGNYVGENALAAVGASFPIMFLFIAVATGLSMGTNVVISQLFGAKKLKDVKSSILTAIIFTAAIGIIFTIIGPFISRPLLELIKTPANVIEDAVIYLQIYFLGALFLFMYNCLTSIFNALGNSKMPLVFLTVSAITNIVLDYVFVVYCNMGVAGVAWATLIAQGLSTILSIIYLLKKLKTIKVEEKYKIYDKTLLKSMMTIALPSILQQTFVSVGMMALQGIVNEQGSTVVAGFTAACKIDSIGMMPIINIANALATYTAQNIGAKEIKRVKAGYRTTMIITTIICVITSIVMFIFGATLVGLFMDSEASKDAIGYGATYLQIVSSFYILMGVMFISGGVLRGAGDMRALIASTIANLAIRIIAAYVLVRFIGVDGIWWSIPIGWAAGAIISEIRYYSNKWKDKIIEKQDSEEIKLLNEALAVEEI